MGLFDKFKDAVSGAAELVGQRAEGTQAGESITVRDEQGLMDEAIRQAKATLPDFLAFCQNSPANTRNHRVKVHFFDGRENEHIWLTDIVQEGDSVRGVVGNNPDLVTNVQAGEEVVVPLEQISDWAFDVGGRQYGSYTVYAMFALMQPGQVQQYVEVYGFTQNPMDTPNASFAQLVAALPKPGQEPPEVEGEEDLPGLDDKLEQELAGRLAHLFEGESPDEEERIRAANNYANQILAELEGSRYEPAAKRLQHKYEQAFLKMLGQSDEDKAAAAVGEDEAIMGITLADYAAASAKLGEGVPLEALAAALGVTAADYDSINEQWAARMAADPTFQVATQFSEYYAAANSNPKVGSL